MSGARTTVGGTGPGFEEVTMDATLIPPTVSSRVRLVPVGRRRWRVLDRSGRAIGQLIATGPPGDERFRAQRFHAARRSFVEVGEFARADEATECLRLLR